jgi:hypothetical protein
MIVLASGVCKGDRALVPALRLLTRGGGGVRGGFRGRPFASGYWGPECVVLRRAGRLWTGDRGRDGTLEAKEDRHSRRGAGLVSEALPTEPM